MALAFLINISVIDSLTSDGQNPWCLLPTYVARVNVKTTVNLSGKMLQYWSQVCVQILTQAFHHAEW